MPVACGLWLQGHGESEGLLLIIFPGAGALTVLWLIGIDALLFGAWLGERVLRPAQVSVVRGAAAPAPHEETSPAAEANPE